MGYLAFTRDSASDIKESNYISTITHDSVTYTIKDAEAQSALAGKQATLVSGTNIKTVNNTSLLGSGNIDTSEVFVATYGTTTYAEITNALSGYKFIFAEGGDILDDLYYLYSGNFLDTDTELYEYHFIQSDSKIIRTLVINSNNVWTTSITNIAKADLSNVSSIDANSAVQTALDGKVNKSGDTMTGSLHINSNYGIINNGNHEGFTQNVQEIDVTSTPSTTKYAGFQINDKNGTRIGKFETAQYTSGNLATSIVTHYNGNYCVIQALMDTNGNKWTYVQPPNASDSGTNIATTQFVHQVIKSGEVGLAANTATWVSFSSAFPNNNVRVAICRRAGANTTAAVNIPFIRGDVYATGFNIYNPNSSNVTIQYIAKWAGS